MFFARSNDSLVMPRELVLSGKTIDVHDFDADQGHKVTNSTTEIDLPTNTIRSVEVPKRLVAHRSLEALRLRC